MGKTEAYTKHIYKHALTLQTCHICPVIYMLAFKKPKQSKTKQTWNDKIQLKDAFWKQKTMLLQFLNYHTKNISGILSLLLPISIWENGNLCFREKRGESEGAFPFLLVYCQHWLPAPTMQPLLVLWQVVLLSLNEIFALSAPLTLQVEIVSTRSGFNVHNLPLSVSPRYMAT